MIWKRRVALLSMLAALAVLVVGQLGGVVAGVAGRDFSRCIQTCNAVREPCLDRCRPDCREAFPGPQREAREACELACEDFCTDQSKECKVVCKAVKDPPSPEEP